MTKFLKVYVPRLAALAFCVLLASFFPPAGLYCGACALVYMFLFRGKEPAQGPLKSTMGGVLLKALGLAGLLVIADLLWTQDLQLGFMVSIFVGIAAIGFWNWGGRLMLPDAYEVMKRDPRPPVVLLRSFKEELRMSHAAPIEERERAATPGGVGGTRHEQDMAAALDRIGPFIAIGRPGDPLATLGASRVYLGDGDWKAFVQSIVPKAAAIVLQPEFTPGTLWEMGLVVNTVDLRRLLIIVPNPMIRPFRYVRVRDLVAETFHMSLPPIEDCGSCEAFYFDSERRPIPLHLSAPQPFVDHVIGLGTPREHR